MLADKPFVMITLLLIILAVPFATAEASVRQSSSSSTSSSVSQSAEVNGESTEVQQESSVRTETDDGVVERNASLNATNRPGEEPQVVKDVDRMERGNATDIFADVDQGVDVTADGVTASQYMEQATGQDTDTMNASTRDTAETSANANSRAEAELNSAVINLRSVFDHIGSVLAGLL